MQNASYASGLVGSWRDPFPYLFESLQEILAFSADLVRPVHCIRHLVPALDPGVLTGQLEACLPCRELLEPFGSHAGSLLSGTSDFEFVIVPLALE
jgi:hypothetical protein